MRPIKFRAWHKKLKAMFPNVAVKEKDILYDTRWYRRDDVIVMQYTGIKDKNEQEIYEGDIVSKGTDTGVVFWHPTEVAFVIIGSMDICDLFESEVIGNIYQNAELLKKEG